MLAYPSGGFRLHSAICWYMRQPKNGNFALFMLFKKHHLPNVLKQTLAAIIFALYKKVTVKNSSYPFFRIILILHLLITDFFFGSIRVKSNNLMQQDHPLELLFGCFISGNTHIDTHIHKYFEADCLSCCLFIMLSVYHFKYTIQQACKTVLHFPHWKVGEGGIELCNKGRHLCSVEKRNRLEPCTFSVFLFDKQVPLLNQSTP